MLGAKLVLQVSHVLGLVPRVPSILAMKTLATFLAKSPSETMEDPQKTLYHLRLIKTLSLVLSREWAIGTTLGDLKGLS